MRETERERESETERERLAGMEEEGLKEVKP